MPVDYSKQIFVFSEHIIDNENDFLQLFVTKYGV